MKWIDEKCNKILLLSIPVWLHTYMQFFFIFSNGVKADDSSVWLEIADHQFISQMIVFPLSGWYFVEELKRDGEYGCLTDRLTNWLTGNVEEYQLGWLARLLDE